MNDLNLIVAIGKDGAIGRKGDLIWKISDDLKRFKSLTTGHPVIMGRKTWDSLPKKPLPNRRNIILTHQKDFRAERAETVNSLEDVLSLTEGQSPFIIGGAEIYNIFLPYADQLYITEINAECPEADAFLHIDYNNGWEKLEESDPSVTPDGVEYKYITYKRMG